MSRTTATSVLAARVASELHLDAATCRAVIREFLRKSAQFLAENQQLTLESLGTLRVVVRKHTGGSTLRYARREGGRYPKKRRVAFSHTVHVSFTKSALLKKLARDYLEEDMDSQESLSMVRPPDGDEER